MLDIINKTLSKLFGNKAETDLKELLPIVQKVKEAEVTISKLSDDELRNKTAEFKNKIHTFIKPIVEEIAELNEKIDSNANMHMGEKEELYKRIDELKKEENKKIEEQ